MFRPTNDTTLSRPDLGQAVWEVQQDAPTMGFVGLQVMPIFPVAEQTGSYSVVPAEALFNIHDTKRNADGAYNRVSEEFEAGYYATNDNGLEAPIDDRKAAIYASRFAYESTIATLLMNKILRGHEYRVKTKLFNTSNFSAVNAGTSWDTASSADPVSDIETGKEVLRKRGVEADTLILPYDGLVKLRLVDDIISRVYKVFADAQKSGQITVAHLQAVFDLPKILVAGALYNSAKKGQSKSLADLWGSQYCMLCKTANPGDDIVEPSIGRTMLWNEGAGGTDMPIVEQYRDEKVRGDVLRVRHDSNEQFLLSYDEDGSAKSEISKNCGYLLDYTAAS
jgi:hypothetical protein